MLTRIEIRNFRGLERLDINLTQATVFVGPNSCGKTTVMQAVQLSCAALAFAARGRKVTMTPEGWLILHGDKPLRDDQSFLPTSRWYELFTGANPAHDICFSLHFSTGHAISQLNVELHAERSDALRMTVSIRLSDGHPLQTLVNASAANASARLAPSDADVADSDTHFGLDEIRKQLSQHLPRAILIPAFYGVIREEEYRARGAVDELLQSGQQALVVRNLIMRLANLEGINAFLTLIGIQAKLEHCTSEQEIDSWRYLRVLFRDSSGSYELASAGTGLASLLALYSAIHFYQRMRAGEGVMIFMFDEPEAHLHPRLQGDVAVRLVEALTSAGNQFLCATHSVEMINRLGRDPRVAVLRIDSQLGGVARVLSTEEDLMDELRVWCDLSPFAQLNLMATRRVIFFEGRSDGEILNGCARLYLGSDPLKLKRYQDFAKVPLLGTGSLGAKDVLRQALLPLFKQLAVGQKIKIVRLLDRDYVREPQQKLKLDNEAHYEELDVVWSCHSIESLFLDPECLTDWLEAALDGPTRPAWLDRAALFKLVHTAVLSANNEPQLNQAAVEQLAPRLFDGRTNTDFVRAIQKARDQVGDAPQIYQHGHSRDLFVLNHVRQTLLSDPQTKGLSNQIRRNIAQMIAKSPHKPSLLLPVTLVPTEIKQVLDFMSID